MPARPAGGPATPSATMTPASFSSRGEDSSLSVTSYRSDMASVFAFLNEGDRAGADPVALRPELDRRSLVFKDATVEADYRLMHARAWNRLWVWATLIICVAAVLTIPAVEITRPRPLLHVALRMTSVIAWLVLYVLCTRVPIERRASYTARVIAQTAFVLSVIWSIQGALLVVDNERDVLLPIASVALTMGTTGALQVPYRDAALGTTLVLVVDGLLSLVGDFRAWGHVLRLILIPTTVIVAYLNDLFFRHTYISIRSLTAQRDAMRAEHERSTRLLLNVIPASVAVHLRAGASDVVLEYPEVAVFYCDIVGFTRYSAARSSSEVVKDLNAFFAILDSIALQIGVEKILTAGDSALVVGGIGEEASASPLGDILAFAEALLDAVLVERNRGSIPDFRLRIGVALGPATGAVVGSRGRFSFVVLGATVSEALAMESGGEQSRIRVSEAAAGRIAADADLAQRFSLDRRADGRIFCGSPACPLPMAGRKPGGRRLFDSLAIVHQQAIDTANKLSRGAVAMPTAKPSGKTDRDSPGLKDSLASGSFDTLLGAVIEEAIDSGDPASVLLDSATMHPWTLAFRDKDQERAFRRRVLVDEWRLVAPVKAGLIAAWLALSLTDLLEGPMDPKDYFASDMFVARAAPLLALVAMAAASGLAAARRSLRIAALAHIGYDASLVLGFSWWALAAPTGKDDLEMVDRVRVQSYVIAFLAAFLSRIPFAATVVLLLLAFGTTVHVYIEAGDDVFSRIMFATMIFVFALFGRYLAERTGRGVFKLRALQEKAADVLARECVTTENLLHNSLPASIVEQLRAPTRPAVIATLAPEASVLFVQRPQETVGDVDATRAFVDLMDEVCVDQAIQRLKVFDTFFLAAVDLDGDDGTGPARITAAALATVARDPTLAVGIARGPVTAGIVGLSRYLYDVYGDTTNLAARLSTTAGAGRVLINEDLAAQVASEFALEPIEATLKGKGTVLCYRVMARASDALPGALQS